MAQLKFRTIGNRQRLILEDGDKTSTLTDFGYNLTAKPSDYYVQAITSVLECYTPLTKIGGAQPQLADVISMVSALFQHMLRTDGQYIRMLSLGTADLGAFYQVQSLTLFSETNSLVVCNEHNPPEDWLTTLNGLGVGDQLVLLTGNYMRALNALGNQRFDIVFISEQSDAPLRDIVLGLKKLKPGGLLIGYRNELVDALFEGEVDSPVPASSVWSKTITESMRAEIIMNYGYSVEKETLNRLYEIGSSIASILDQWESLEEQDVLLRDMGAALTACERTVAELAAQSGNMQIKLLLNVVKEQYTSFAIHQRTAQLHELKYALRQWLQSLEAFEKWCIYER